MDRGSNHSSKIHLIPFASRTWWQRAWSWQNPQSEETMRRERRVVFAEGRNLPGGKVGVPVHAGNAGEGEWRTVQGGAFFPKGIGFACECVHEDEGKAFCGGSRDADVFSVKFKDFCFKRFFHFFSNTSSLNSVR